MIRLPRLGAGWLAGWRGLGRFWLAVVAIGALGAAVLQWLGPPPPPAHPVRPIAQAGSPGLQPPRPLAAPRPPPDALPPERPPGQIADPDQALEEPARDGSGYLPRIAPDGRTPMQMYAGRFDRTTRLPRVALLLAGIGLSDADSTAAVRTLPAGISLAISPYAPSPAALLTAVRRTGHEYLLSLPMEPQGFPNNDPGPQALMTNLGEEENLVRLTHFLAHLGGYAGVTSAMGALRGERMEAMTEQLEPILTAIGGRGLYWVDTRTGQGALPGVWSRSIDLVVDEPASAADLDARLNQLAQMAKDHGSALGLATAPRPVTIDRIAAWTVGLPARGVVLAPVSAVLRQPAQPEETAR
jgi:polysaccharide deacetylase 2 family uncharacterized protein YibQ